MKRLLALVILASTFAAPRIWAQGTDDQYIRIYNLIQQADSLNNLGQFAQALAKYTEAQTALQRFQTAYPLWNPQVVKFRVSYLATKIAAVAARLPPPPAPPTPGTSPAPPPTGPSPQPPAQSAPPPDWTNQLNTLQEQVRQLQADKSLLEAKLREAFSAQPAAADPRELARAEETIKFLQKDNDLLKASLAQQKLKPAADSKALEEARQALAHAKRELDRQTEKADTLEREKAALQTKLDKLKPGSNDAAIERTRKALAEANRKLAAQTDEAKKLSRQKEDLEARVKVLAADSQAAAALRAENEILKKQVAAGRGAPAGARQAEATRRQLAQARIRIATLQSDMQILLFQKAALQKRLNQAPVAVATALPQPPPPRPKDEDTRRLKQLERERDDLRKQLQAVNKQLARRINQVVPSRVQEVEAQLAALQAQLEVFEARRVPYTAEELAVLRPPEPELAASELKAGKSVKELPPGTTSFVLQARQHFSAKQFDKAEQDYLEVLRQDPRSVPSLANLATIQLQLNKLDDADKHIQQALALEPNDLVSLSVLGQLRFRQRRYDDALDAFSRAAKLDPQDAQLQNFLGLALSEKGLRGPAEAAFRRAVQIDPTYGDAHKNLAFVYLTQQPPLVELARWHYQKALAAGSARNPELEKLFEARKAIE